MNLSETFPRPARCFFERGTIRIPGKPENALSIRLPSQKSGCGAPQKKAAFPALFGYWSNARLLGESRSSDFAAPG